MHKMLFTSVIRNLVSFMSGNVPSERNRLSYSPGDEGGDKYVNNFLSLLLLVIHNKNVFLNL